MLAPLAFLQAISAVHFLLRKMLRKFAIPTKMEYNEYQEKKGYIEKLIYREVEVIL